MQRFRDRKGCRAAHLVYPDPRPMRKGSLIAVALVLSALGAGRGQEQDDDRVYRSELHGFRVQRPTSWVFHEQADAGAGAFTLNLLPPGSKGEVRAHVRVGPAGSERTPAAVLERILGGLGSKPEYRETKTLSGEIAGRDAPGVETIYRAADGKDYRIRVLVLVEEDVRYLCTCLAPGAVLPAGGPKSGGTGAS